MMARFISLTKALLALSFTTMLFMMTVESVNAEDRLPKQIELALYKNPNCGCCDKWAQHLDENNINTEIHTSEKLSQLKEQLGISPRMSSCHTGIIKQDDKKYFFEGHIPAKFIHKFLDNPPEEVVGLSVPAMPVGSPGMEYKNKFMPYKIFKLHKNGQISVYAEINSAEQQYE